MTRDWTGYYVKTGERPPRETLVFALDQFEEEPSIEPRFAVDLGSGNGRDTIELLRRGWPTLAIDSASEAIAMLRSRSDLPADVRLETANAHFEDYEWPLSSLVNASFSLPLCRPDRFAALWQKLVVSLRPGGRFAGQFFGNRDSFADRPGVTTMTLGEAETLLQPFLVELFREEEEDSVTPRGTAKHWHIFHIVARLR